MKPFVITCLVLILALSAVVVLEEPRPLAAGRHPFAGGALSIDLPGGGEDVTERSPAAAAVAGFRFVVWSERGLWVASAALPAPVLRGLVEGALPKALAHERVSVPGADEAWLVLRDDVGADGVPDAQCLVLLRGEVGYEVNAGFRDAVAGERERARELVLSTRLAAVEARPR